MDKPKQVIKVAKLPKPTPKPFEPLAFLARFCYLYPQYTLAQARKLPYKRVRLLLTEAERQQAVHLSYLTQIIAAPHSKEASKNIKQLLEHFGSIIDGR